VALRSLFILFLSILSTIHAQTSDKWETHNFENYEIEFQTPSNWSVTIAQNFDQNYIECLSPDNQIYFFITSSENEKKSSNDVVLSYLKVTYANSQFLNEEQKKINNIDFLFTTGVNSLEDIQTFIKLGVGNHKKRVYMIDSGYNSIGSKDAEATLTRIIESMKAID